MSESPEELIAFVADLRRTALKSEARATDATTLAKYHGLAIKFDGILQLLRASRMGGASRAAVTGDSDADPRCADCKRPYVWRRGMTDVLCRCPFGPMTMDLPRDPQPARLSEGP